MTSAEYLSHMRRRSYSAPFGVYLPIVRAVEEAFKLADEWEARANMLRWEEGKAQANELRDRLIQTLGLVP